MATNLALDDKLIDQAKRVGRHKTKKAAVTTALQEYVRRHEQKKVFRLTGKVEYEPTYDYKSLRKAKRF